LFSFPARALKLLKQQKRFNFASKNILIFSTKIPIKDVVNSDSNFTPIQTMMCGVSINGNQQSKINHKQQHQVHSKTTIQPRNKQDKESKEKITHQRLLIQFGPTLPNLGKRLISPIHYQ